METNRDWHSVPGYEGLYEVSNDGVVRTIVGQELKQRSDAHGYRRVNLWRDGKSSTIRVHRIVLLAFVGPPTEGMEGCHNDGDRSNNHVSNLRWDTHRSNVADAVIGGTHIGAQRASGKCARGHAMTRVARGTECKPCRNERLAARRGGRAFDPERADARAQGGVGS